MNQQLISEMINCVLILHNMCVSFDSPSGGGGGDGSNVGGLGGGWVDVTIGNDGDMMMIFLLLEL